MKTETLIVTHVSINFYHILRFIPEMKVMEILSFYKTQRDEKRLQTKKFGFHNYDDVVN